MISPRDCALTGTGENSRLYGIQAHSGYQLLKPRLPAERRKHRINSDIDGIERAEVDDVLEFIQGSGPIADPHLPGGTLVSVMV